MSTPAWPLSDACRAQEHERCRLPECECWCHADDGEWSEVVHADDDRPPAA